MLAPAVFPAALNARPMSGPKLSPSIPPPQNYARFFVCRRLCARRLEVNDGFSPAFGIPRAAKSYDFRAKPRA